MTNETPKPTVVDKIIVGVIVLAGLGFIFNGSSDPTPAITSQQEVRLGACPDTVRGIMQARLAFRGMSCTRVDQCVAYQDAGQTKIFMRCDTDGGAFVQYVGDYDHSTRRLSLARR